MKDSEKKERSTKNKIKLLKSHIIDHKSIGECAKELGVSRKTIHTYKSSDDFRMMAIAHLDNSKLKGLTGTTSKLIKALDATKPIVTENADGSTSITSVPDRPTQLKAIQEVHKIYGVYAATKKDTTLTVSISSDAELFEQIDKAQRGRRHVESYVQGERGLEVVAGESEDNKGDFATRERALLQDGPIPESVGRVTELAVRDNMEHAEV